jgi:peptidyl-prolyl cis-trans isomerase SurA
MLSDSIKWLATVFMAVTTSSAAVSEVVPLDSVIAIVDEDIILSSEVFERIDQVKASAAQRQIALPDDETILRETLDQLILQSIQLQLADRYGVRIPDAQLDQSMTRIAAQNGMTLEQFQQALAANGQDFAVRSVIHAKK